MIADGLRRRKLLPLRKRAPHGAHLYAQSLCIRHGHAPEARAQMASRAPHS